MKRMIVIAVLVLMAAVLVWKSYGPTASVRLRIVKIEQGSATKTAAQLARTMSVEIPGPNGRKVTGLFYGLNKLAPSSDDLCALLRSELDEGGPAFDLPLSDLSPKEAEKMRREGSKTLKSSAEALWQLGCASSDVTTRQSSSPAARDTTVIALAHMLTNTSEQPLDDERRVATTIRWTISRMKALSTLEEQRSFLASACTVRLGPRPLPLAGQRFAADCHRLHAAICDETLWSTCRAEKLTNAGSDYAVLGRLENDERHFRDTEAVLDEAEPLVRLISDHATRTRLLGDIVAAFGYAGEAGRDLRLLKRSSAIAGKTLEELHPGPTPFEKEEYAEAWDRYATTVSRLAPFEADRIAATRHAVETQERSIAFRASVTPDAPSWASRVNLSTDQRALFELTLENTWIDQAIDNARLSLVLVAKLDGRGTENDFTLPYVRMRLGEALVWRSKHGTQLEPAVRNAGFEEAKEHLAAAEQVFRRINAQAYLRYLNAAQRLLPEDTEKR